MPPRFTAPSLALSRAVDAHYGELLRFTPKQGRDNWGKPTGAPDGRLPIDVIGTFAEGAQDFEFLAGDKRNSDFSAQTVNHEAWATAERWLFPLGNEPKKGDLIQTIEQPRPATWEILEVVTDGLSRFAFPLVRAS